ncbi:unnamed protein product, partial [Staurois parvus]
MRGDTENDTRHPGQEKWDCAESIHTEWGQIPRMTPGIRDRRSGTVQSPYRISSEKLQLKPKCPDIRE